jgi:hypothetical protein
VEVFRSFLKFGREFAMLKFRGDLFREKPLPWFPASDIVPLIRT